MRSSPHSSSLLRNYLLEWGADAHIQLLLGHRDLEETTLYLHLSNARMSATASPLDKLKLAASSSRRRIDEPAIARDGRYRSQCGPELHRTQSFLVERLHLKVLTAIERCRTAALGGHLDECVRCGHRVISQLLQKQALPQVPGERSRPLAPSASARLCPHPTSMLSSRCPMNWHHWLCRTSGWFTTCCFGERRNAVGDLTRSEASGS